MKDGRNPKEMYEVKVGKTNRPRGRQLKGNGRWRSVLERERRNVEEHWWEDKQNIHATLLAERALLLHTHEKDI